MLYSNGALKTTHYYAGLYEKKIIAGGNTLEYLYIPGGDGTAAVLIKTNGNAGELNYIHKDHLGSIVCITSETGTIKEQFNYDPWGRRRNPSDWSFSNVPVPTLLTRGFTGHEHLEEFALINMNGRVYDPALGMFLSPDNYVQAPENSLNFNRYSYCLNNPLFYTDPNGEFFWYVPIIIGAAIYGTGNLAIHAMNGDIHNFWDALKFFGQGAVAGAVVGATWSFGLASLNGSNLLGGGTIIQGMGFASQGFVKYLGWSVMAGKTINTISTIGSFVSNPENVAKILLGRTYLDENSSFLGGLWQGISRYTWEGLQTWVGYNYTQLRNMIGNVDRVDYLGGATFATDENAGFRDGVSLGNFININISDKITGNFVQRVISDPLFMHEYGHYIDSQIFGLAYLFAVGIPSAHSANNAIHASGYPAGVTSHDLFWTERRANRNAKNYFKKHYDVNWNSISPYYPYYPIETYYPTW